MSVNRKKNMTEDELVQWIFNNCKINETTGCFDWQRSNIKGYGQIKIKSKNYSIHRFIYEYLNGKTNLFVLHSCDRRCCCNPAHLSAGTNTDNMRQMVDRGRNKPTNGENNGSAKLTNQLVEKIRNLYFSGNISHRKLAKQFNISRSNVGLIIRNNTWR